MTMIETIAKRRAAAALFDAAMAETRKANPALNESAVFDRTMRDNTRARDEWWPFVKGEPAGTDVRKFTSDVEMPPTFPNPGMEFEAELIASRKFAKLSRDPKALANALDEKHPDYDADVRKYLAASKAASRRANAP
jgi:hypothetical protein